MDLKSNDPQGDEAVALRVLIADDYPDISHLLAVMLGRLGYEVRSCSNGQECLDVAASFLPHVVLLDIAMPDMDGYHVARRLQQQAGATRPTLIAITGFGREVDYQKSSEAGFALHMLKPIQVEELKRVLVQLAAIESGTPMDSAIRWLNPPHTSLCH